MPEDTSFPDPNSKNTHYGFWIPTLIPMSPPTDYEPRRNKLTSDKIESMLIANCQLSVDADGNNICTMIYGSPHKFRRFLSISCKRKIRYAINESGLTLLEILPFESAGVSDPPPKDGDTYTNNLADIKDDVILSDCARFLVDYHHTHVHHIDTDDLLLGKVIEKESDWQTEIINKIRSLYYKKIEAYHKKITRMHFPIKHTLSDKISFGYRGVGELKYAKSFAHLAMNTSDKEKFIELFDNASQSLAIKQLFCNVSVISKTSLLILFLGALFCLYLFYRLS